MPTLIGSPASGIIVAPNAGDIVDASSSSNGTPGDNANLTSVQYISFSPDGSEVAFDVFGGDLVQATAPLTDEIYVKNFATGAITEITPPAPGGSDGLAGAGQAMFSMDGSTLYFTNDGNGEIYAENIATGAFTLLSQTTAGVVADAYSYVNGVVGNNLYFESAADNLSPDATTITWREYVENLTTGAITLLADTGGQAVSADGSMMAVTEGTGVNQQIYVVNLATGVQTLASTSASGVVADFFSAGPALSADGTELAFISGADNLVPGTENNSSPASDPPQRLYVKNLVTGAISLVSTNAEDVVDNGGNVSTAAFSPDGTEIAFVSTTTNLVPGDTSDVEAVYVKNLVTGAISLVSTSASGQQGDGVIEDLTFRPMVANSPFRIPRR